MTLGAINHGMGLGAINHGMGLGAINHGMGLGAINHSFGLGAISHSMGLGAFGSGTFLEKVLTVGVLGAAAYGGYHFFKGRKKGRGVAGLFGKKSARRRRR